MKIVAVLLGPAGIGLVGLYLSLIQTAASAAGMGIGTAGTRRIVAAQIEGGNLAVARTRRTLFTGSLVLALLGAGVFWLASGWIARSILLEVHRTNEVAWLSVGVGITVVVAAQGAVLTGLRRIGDIARISVGSGIIGSIFGMFAVWLWSADGLVAMLLISTIASFLLGHFYLSRLETSNSPSLHPSQMIKDWESMIRQGFPFMLSGLVTLIGFLAVRAQIQNDLGPEALGLFQASWTIGVTYLGFVLGAMGTDYYPRLTASISDPKEATRLVNEQTEVALLLCAPILLALLGCAPWMIRLLYSIEFAPAAEILRWQLMADIMKVISWPLGFVLLAKGMGSAFLGTQLLGMATFLITNALLMPKFGIAATGLAFITLYCILLSANRVLSGYIINFRWTRAVKAQAIVIAGGALTVDITARGSVTLGAAMGLAAATILSLWSLMRLSAKAEAGGRLKHIGVLGERVKKWTNGPR